MSSDDESFEQALSEHRAGRLREAEQAYRQVLARSPEMAVAWSNLAGLLAAQGRRDEALAALRSALALVPDQPEVHYNMAVLAVETGDLAAAANSYRLALEAWPDFSAALRGYGALMRGAGQFHASLTAAERAIAVDPRSSVAHVERGRACHAGSQPREAVASFEEATRLDPTDAEAWEGLATALNGSRLFDAALRASRQGIAAAGERSSLYAAAAIALHHLACGGEAVAAHRRAVELDPVNAAEHSNLLYALNFQADAAPEAVFAEHRAWAVRHAEPLSAAASPCSNDRTPERRLRIGYVSPYFCRHAVNHFSEPLIVHHDRAQFEIHLYNVGRGEGDDATRRLRAAVDGWHDVARDDDAQLARRVRDDAIDILVDLSGHIAGSRLLTFARKPAPVQIAYLGYQNTTGMSAMDYRFTDAWADPPGTSDRFYTEQLVRLSPTFFCYRPPDDAPGVGPLPAQTRGHVTFGSFNNLAKINPLVLEAWMTLLTRLPGSRLVVLGPTRGSWPDRLHAAAAANEIDPGRIETAERRGQREYLELVGQVDIALDPFPFNGHTTTCDALWMGVPVVALAGQTYAARFGSSGLVQLGLDDWVAASVSEYIEITLAASRDLTGLARLRRELRPRMAASALMDYPRFSRAVEAAYRQMWRAWCASAAKGAG